MVMMRRGADCVVLILLFAAADASNILRHVHVITRHGSRFPLSKNPTNLKEGKSINSELTALGEKQLYDLGLWLKARYSGRLNASYQSDSVRLESSETDRTVVSANALAMGLFDATSRDPANETLLPFPLRPNVPVYTISPINDVIFRAYDKCQAYQNRLEDLYAGAEYQKLQQDYAALLTKLATIPEFAPFKDETTNSIPVEQVWNVFDLIFVAKTECDNADSSATCQALPQVHTILESQEWIDLKALANTAELLKYSKETAGRLVGGNMLERITKRMILYYNNDQGDAKFYLYSAHYPTILGVLAALGEEPIEGGEIPAYGSALIFELYDRSSDPGIDDLIVDIYFKPGGNDTAIQLGSVCSPTKDCVFPDLFSYVTNNIVAKDWCQECANDAADICLARLNAAYADSLSRAAAAESSPSSSSCSKKKLSLVGIFTGVVVGFLGALLLLWNRERNRERKRRAASTAPSVPVDAIIA